MAGAESKPMQMELSEGESRGRVGAGVVMRAVWCRLHRSFEGLGSSKSNGQP